MTRAISITKVKITDFKKIETLELDLKPINALVGGNTSGKSSVLQALQLCMSLLQASYLGITNAKNPKKRKHDFRGSITDDDVSFRPTQKLLDLKRGGRATQKKGFEITVEGTRENDSEAKVCSFTLEVKRGKNANISLNIEGDDQFAGDLAAIDRPNSGNRNAAPKSGQTNEISAIFTPGLSGVAMSEELKTIGALSRGVMQGNANNYVRSVLLHLSKQDEKWTQFSKMFSSIYEGARVDIDHDEDIDHELDVVIEYKGEKLPLDLASTGMLQCIQILSYACFFRPLLFLLDEPDAHLHADNQVKLLKTISTLSHETGTKIILTTHSPAIVDVLDREDQSQTIWIDNGKQMSLPEGQNIPEISLLMQLGMTSIGNDMLKPKRTFLLTEDTVSTELIKTFAHANGAPEDLILHSYGSCRNLDSARVLADFFAKLHEGNKVIIHRDRDFRTSEEMEFERLRFKEWIEEEKTADNVFELFTPFNDIEHSFCQIEHINHCIKGFDNIDAESIVNEAIADQRDNFVSALDKARDVIKGTLYVQRHKSNDYWKKAKLPDKSPRA